MQRGPGEDRANLGNQEKTKRMSSEKQISRNQACPCGSGIKYKRCCGNMANQGGVIPISSKQQLYSEAESLRLAGKYETAKQKFETILRNSPDEAPATTGLGLCLLNLGESGRGLEELRRAVKLAPNELSCINHLVVNLFNQGIVEESLEWSLRAVKMGPEGAKANVMVANCYEKLHRIDEALEANRLAQIANPGVKYLKLQEAKLNARNGDYQRAENILRKAIEGPDLEPELKAQMLGELARVLDKLENYQEAFQLIAQSGEVASGLPRVQQFNLGTRPGLINAYIKGLTEERLNKWKPDDLKDDSWTPTFLVGFPRSGTTMTEQILAAHSGVITTDERPYLEQVRFEWARIIGANPDLGWMADQLDVKTILQLRRLYREKVQADQQSPIGSNVLIDKLPLNIMHIGLINLIFPDAKIIVVLRDPRDSCLSCLMQEFDFNSAMIHFLSLDKAVHFYTQVMGSWLHFRDFVTLSHLTVRYEDIVRNLEFEAKRLFDYLNIEWEPEVLEFHKRAKKRVILTPSYAAVTETVHTRAMGRWINYQEHFRPLLPTLEPFIHEFGYDAEGV